MESLWQDVRHGIRVLGKHRGFTAVAVLTLALGIGANTAIFSIVDAVLLRPLPYPGADRLVRVAEQGGPIRTGGSRAASSGILTNDTFDAWRDATATLDGIAAYAQRSYTLTGLGDPVRIRGAAVSAALFQMLQVAPEAGRVFTRANEQSGADQVAVISDALWTTRFAHRADIVGAPITLDDRQVTVVGVLPPSFYFPDRDAQIWMPMVMPVAAAQRPGQQMIFAFSALARLKAGTSIEQAAAEGTTVAARAHPAPLGPRPAGAAPLAVRLIPLQQDMVAGIRPALLVLVGAVTLVLLIAIANVANLLLARGAARQRELAVRTALGARRVRLLRQLLTESVLLGLVGGALGVGLAFGLQRLLPAIAPGNIPRLDEVAIDARVLAFATGLAILAGLLFGLAPGLQGSRINVVGTLNEAGMQRSGGFRLVKGNRFRGLLVVAEVALSLVLLAGAGLLVHSFVDLMNVDPGYDPANVVTAQVSLPPGRYAAAGARQVFFDELLDRLSAMHGVKAVGTTNLLPLLPGNIILSFGIVGQPPPTNPQDAPHASLRIVSPGYAAAMGLRLRAGRWLTDRDTAATPMVVLVNETLARTYLGGSAVGQHIQLLGPAEIVGVVGDVRHSGLDTAPQPEMYIAFKQMPPTLQGPMGAGATAIVVRAAGDPLQLVPALRQAILQIDPNLPIDNVATMDARLATSVAEPRFYALLLGAFGLLALLLAAVGIYGVLSHNVSERHREIGVRMALGAERRTILALVVRQGLLLTAAGVVVGLLAAVAATRLLSSLLFSITAADPLTYVGATILLLAVAFLACWIPARRATRVDPMTALRYE